MSLSLMKKKINREMMSKTDNESMVDSVFNPPLTYRNYSNPSSLELPKKHDGLILQQRQASPDDVKEHKNKNCQGLSFPETLMEVLSNEQNSDCISWLPCNQSFKITNSDKFSKTIIPKYFKTIKYTTFIRILNKWRFMRHTDGIKKDRKTHF